MVPVLILANITSSDSFLSARYPILGLRVESANCYQGRTEIFKGGGLLKLTHKTSRDIEWMLFGTQHSKKSPTWNSNSEFNTRFLWGGNQ